MNKEAISKEAALINELNKQGGTIVDKQHLSGLVADNLQLRMTLKYLKRKLGLLAMNDKNVFDLVKVIEAALEFGEDEKLSEEVESIISE